MFKLGAYWITVPQAYDSSHNTPTTLFVWSHGCGGQDVLIVWREGQEVHQGWDADHAGFCLIGFVG